MDELRVDYSTFISLSESKNLPIQYTKSNSTYWLVLAEGSITWGTFLVYGTADYDDFETNYKPTANGPVVQAVSSAPIMSSVISSVSASIISVELLAANPFRKMATIYNDSNSILYVTLGSGVTSTNFTVKMNKNDYYEFPQPMYLGSVEAIWSVATGSAKITEFS